MILPEVKDKLSNTKLFILDNKVLIQVIACLSELGYQVDSINPFIFIDDSSLVKTSNSPYVYTSITKYREIKPDVIFDLFNYTPFTCASEVMQAIKKHGAWIKAKEGKEELSAIVDIDTADVTVIRYGKLCSMSFKNLLNNYIFEDGTPAGKNE